ncbi:MAG: hypothetical protein DMD95_13325 [Candidatus Rokuibacteriota bacterium]|nr:MAG: hypothetical protein DMD95_13325 [Candidatus Rokubacteria bacterium]
MGRSALRPGAERCRPGAPPDRRHRVRRAGRHARQDRGRLRAVGDARRLYWKVLLPAIVPSVLAGMRLGVVFCLLGVLVVEMFAGVRGMGYVMGSLANGFQAPELFAATGLVSAASIAIVLALDHLNDKLSHWRG